MGSDPRTPTIPRVTTGKLSSKRLPSLKLLAAFSALISKGKAFTMSWDNQVSAEEGRNLVFGLEIAPQVTQRPQAPMFGLLNIIYRSAESVSKLERKCDVMHDSDILSHTLSHSVMHNSVTHNVTHNTDLWDSDHHALSLSEFSRHLETNTKILSSFLKQHPLGEHPIQ